jgi:flavin reductase (DIM6/NTAB) family NADH-FMN oxidoreductase RutF
MDFDFEGMSPTARFAFLTGTVVPRPIALITTVSPSGALNAAPYTFFSIAGIDPPIVTVTVLPTADGRMKDTGENILSTGEFVINLVSEDLAAAMNTTCIDAPPGVNELALANLETALSAKVRPPRIAASPVALECRLHSTVPLSVNQVLIVGRIIQAHVADKFVINPSEPIFDTPAFRLIGGMHGAKWYTRTTDLFEMERPTWANRDV